MGFFPPFFFVLFSIRSSPQQPLYTCQTISLKQPATYLFVKVQMAENRCKDLKRHPKHFKKTLKNLTYKWIKRFNKEHRLWLYWPVQNSLLAYMQTSPETQRRNSPGVLPTSYQNKGIACPQGLATMISSRSSWSSCNVSSPPWNHHTWKTPF